MVNLGDPNKLTGLFSGIILLALAAFVFIRRPGNPAAGAFLIIMAILGSTRLSETLPNGFPEWIDPVARNLQHYVNESFFFALLSFALIRFALVFPHPKPIHQRHPWLSYAAGAIGFILNFSAFGSSIGWFWFVFSFFLTVIILIHNAYTMRDTVSRAQLRWGLGGLIIGFGTLALMLLGGTLGLFEFNPDIFNLMSAFATTVMGSMLAVAILRYRLFDVDVIIRRTLVYTVLTITLALLYFGSVVLLQTLLEGISGQESPIAIVISTLGIAALFTPLHRRVQDTIDRRLYRQKYDAVQALESFAASARDETDVQRLTTEMVKLVQETLQPETVMLWMQPIKTNPVDQKEKIHKG